MARQGGQHVQLCLLAPLAWFESFLSSAHQTTPRPVHYAPCLQTQGRLQRHIAHHLLLPPVQKQLAAEGAAAAIAGRHAADTASSSSSARASLYGTGRFVKAHRLSPTALALTSDEQKMYSVSKDGLILKWDVETMQRVQVFRWAHLRGGEST